ncbi:hypothetical protein CCR75_000397 [Bremia lactucae]|uniref:Uncharacterized protein n=1 Tax=Bremia lactucae TaxID=4779 RepID=A0A976FJ74_BRELC|nr:hypothetical protein CCR75_000397 [Bremia lactucae]
METFDERPQIELTPSANQGFTGLRRGICIVKNVVYQRIVTMTAPATFHIVLQAVMNQSMSSRYRANSIAVTCGEMRGTLRFAQRSSEYSRWLGL